MAYCGKCGAELREGIAFCGACGTPIQVAPPPANQIPPQYSKTQKSVPKKSSTSINHVVLAVGAVIILFSVVFIISFIPKLFNSSKSSEKNPTTQQQEDRAYMQDVAKEVNQIDEEARKSVAKRMQNLIGTWSLIKYEVKKVGQPLELDNNFGWSLVFQEDGNFREWCQIRGPKALLSAYWWCGQWSISDVGNLQLSSTYIACDCNEAKKAEAENITLLMKEDKQTAQILIQRLMSEDCKPANTGNSFLVGVPIKTWDENILIAQGRPYGDINNEYEYVTITFKKEGKALTNETQTKSNSNSSLDSIQSESPCAGAQNTIEISECWQNQYNKADAELNKIYKEIMANLDQNGKNKLRDSQRTWIAYRDKQADEASSQYEGGTLASVAHIQTLAELTQKRVKELKDTYGYGL